ncbi:MAG TPA: histidine kinase [Arachidicoccus sp.]
MANEAKRNILKLAVHLLVWCILIVFAVNEKGPGYRLTHIWTPIIESAVIFYLDYLLLINKFIFAQKRYGLFVISNLVVILFFRFDMAIVHYTEAVFNNSLYAAHPADNPHRSDSLSFMRSALELTLPAAAAIIIRTAEIWQRIELERKQAENIQLETELKNLKYQLQPHFFFNVLNTIYSLIDISPEKAQEAIHSLSKLMRYLLYDTAKEKIKLSDEISFLTKYIQLMQLRMNDNTITEFLYPELLMQQVEIAPLLFIPLIENAYKHGVSLLEPSNIFFELRQKENTVFFTASNGNFSENENDKSESGIGLENLRNRLNLIYPGKHIFTQEIIEGMFFVTLKIEL